MSTNLNQQHFTPPQYSPTQDPSQEVPVNINNIWDTPKNPNGTSPPRKENVDPQGFFEKLNYNGLISDLIRDNYNTQNLENKFQGIFDSPKVEEG